MVYHFINIILLLQLSLSIDFERIWLVRVRTCIRLRSSLLAYTGPIQRYNASVRSRDVSSIRQTRQQSHSKQDNHKVCCHNISSHSSDDSTQVYLLLLIPADHPCPSVDLYLG